MSTIERTKLISNLESENTFKLDLNDRDYSNQYFHIYQFRLQQLKERVRKECIAKWKNGFQLQDKPVVEKKKVLDIQGKEPCWAVGTIYCEMKYKPNILTEVINDTYGAPDLVKSYTAPDGSDEIMLEDESGRVLLVGDFIKSTPFVTGVVVGLLGMEADAGTFQVLDICYPTPLVQKSLPDPTTLKGKKVALVSGLNISTTSPEHPLKLQLLQELMMGRLFNQEKISQVGKLIICGNSVDVPITEASSGKLISCLEEMGVFLVNTLQSISIDLMPGYKDPTDKALPQQPLHKALFKDSIKKYIDDINRDILYLTTNPYKFDTNGLDILATSGENINDICKYVIPHQNSESQECIINDTSVEHRLDLMECTLKWQNIAPTSPDTLWSYPFKDSDPFILNEWPHVYIAGNQPQYGSKDVDINGCKIKMISVPEYSTTGSVVLLDLETLETEVITIEI